jgi:hypothetical protein
MAQLFAAMKSIKNGSIPFRVRSTAGNGTGGSAAKGGVQGTGAGRGGAGGGCAPSAQRTVTHLWWIAGPGHRKSRSLGQVINFFGAHSALDQVEVGLPRTRFCVRPGAEGPGRPFVHPVAVLLAFIAGAALCCA